MPVTLAPCPNPGCGFYGQGRTVQDVYVEAGVYMAPPYRCGCGQRLPVQHATRPADRLDPQDELPQPVYIDPVQSVLLTQQQLASIAVGGVINVPVASQDPTQAASGGAMSIAVDTSGGLTGPSVQDALNVLQQAVSSIDATTVQVATPAGVQSLAGAVSDIFAQLSELATFN